MKFKWVKTTILKPKPFQRYAGSRVWQTSPQIANPKAYQPFSNGEVLVMFYTNTSSIFQLMPLFLSST